MADANPYVGPTSFEETNSTNFFGRDEETRELVSLIIARRAVLLYAQSGAGKTSLLKASVIPSLKRRKRMDVFPIARVVGATVPGEANVYVANALAHLTASSGLAGQTMKDALGPLLDTGGRTPRLLVFDQFEEIFTYHPERYADRKAFFQQLNDCLTDYPQLSLLLSMREDYLADLDSFAGFLPDRMRTRMRLERLPAKAAVAAVSKPAALAGKPFAEGVAEGLVDNLRRVQTARGRQNPGHDDPAHRPDGRGPDLTAEPHAPAGANAALGKYVEPVQLQIVCWQLWSHLPNEAPAITEREVEEYGDVDDALTKFYRDALAEAQKDTPVTERTLRRWFSEELITPARTRGLVYQGETDTAGLPNEAVAVLRERYIVRADVRGDDTWFELAHDRLVEPILEDNQNWRASYRNPVADAHERWETGGRDPGKLLNGNQLIEARAYAAEHPRELTPEERKFLDTSIEEEKRLRQRRRTLIMAGTAVGLAVAVLAVWALFERRNAAAEARRATEALAMVQKASSNLYVQEAARVWQDQPDEALAYAEQALRADPDSLAARSWVSSLLLRQSWWVPGAVIDPPERKGRGNQQVASAAFNPDGRRIVTASGNIAAIWHADTGLPVGQPMRHPNYVWFAGFSPDGQRVVTYGSEFIARVWDAGSANIVRAINPGGEIVFAGFSPDGRRLVTISNVWTHPEAGSSPSVAVWDIATGERVSVIGERHSRLYSAAFSPDGRELVTYSLGSISRWDVDTGNAVGLPLRQELGVSFAGFSSDGSRIVTAHPNWTVGVVDAASGAQASAGLAHHGVVSSAALSRDGRYVVSASSDRTARLWEADNGRFLGIVGRHEGRVLAAAFSPDGRRIVTASEDGTARVWETLSGQPVSSPAEERRYGIPRQQSLEPENSQGVRILKVSAFAGGLSPDGRRLIAVDAERAARVWETDTGKPAGIPLRHDDGITSVGFSRDGRLILTASGQGVRVWDAGTGKLLHPIQPERSTRFFSAAFSPDGRSILTTGFGGQLWDVQTGKLVDSLPATGHLLSASWNPDGKLIVTSDSSGFIRVWEGNSEAQPMQTNGSTVSAVFSPKGDRLVTGAGDRAIVWDVKARIPVGRPMAHGASVYSATFSPDGRLVSTASMDRTAQVWNAETSLPVGLPMVHPAGVLWAGFAPDGRRVATVAGDGVGRLWTVLLGDGSENDTGLLLELAAALNGRLDPGTRTQRIRELRKVLSEAKPGQTSAASSLRKLLGFDDSL